MLTGTFAHNYSCIENCKEVFLYYLVYAFFFVFVLVMSILTAANLNSDHQFTSYTMCFLPLYILFSLLLVLSAIIFH